MKKTLLSLSVLAVSGVVLAGCTYGQPSTPQRYEEVTTETMMKASPTPQNDTPETLESDLNGIKLEEETFQ
jgi:hypothetical protein